LEVYIILEKLNIYDRSYLIGLFQGDGHLYQATRNRGKFIYEVAIRDRDIIYKIEKILSPYVNVSIYEKIRDTNFKDKFHSIGFNIYYKDFRTEISEYIPYGKRPEYINIPQWISKRDYIRGLIDADGSLGFSKYGFCFLSFFTVSENIKNFIINDMRENIGVIKKINRNKRDLAYNILLYREDAQDYARILYEDANLYIERKYNKYLDILKWIRDPNVKRGYKRSWTKRENEIISMNNISIEEKMFLLNRTKSSITTRLWRLKKT
jgi:hypothetical protein